MYIFIKGKQCTYLSGLNKRNILNFKLILDFFFLSQKDYLCFK